MTKELRMTSGHGSNRGITRRGFGAGALGTGLILGTGRAPALAQGRRDLRVGTWGGEFGNLSPVIRSDIQGSLVMYNVFDGLVSINYKDRAVVPNMALEWSNPDPLTWRIKIREGVKWQKGFGEFTADDVVYTFNFHMSSKSFQMGTALFPIESVKSDGKYVVEMKTKQRWVHQTGPANNDYHTLIYYDTRYRIVATKEGYSKDSLEFRTDDLKKDPFQRIRRELFLRPLTLQAYLPIVLYFDNDKPGPARRGVTSIAGEYKDTYLPYYNRKQEYINTFCQGLTGPALEAARYELDTFFERRVKGEWDRMRMFSEVLYEMLENGDHVNIRISGFASPLASPEYNLDLTSRRVSSIINHFTTFDVGYKEFLAEKQLVLTREPNGAAKAPKSVSDDPKNRRLSVFSVDAARERRVEIIGVDVNGNAIPIPFSLK